MQLEFLRAPADQRRQIFEAAAIQRQMQPAILEKDFWVCWLLAILFDKSEIAEQILFKGGTSLSKVFGVIERFSEDLELGVAPALLGIAEAEVDDATSRNQRERWMERLEKACGQAVREQLQPPLERAIRELLGPREGGAEWLEFVHDEVTHSPVLWFNYPTNVPEGFAYIRRAVKLEFGSLTDQRPLGRHAVKPWIAEVFPAAFTDWRCEVVALEVERTFWEKATILHKEFHRPRDLDFPKRLTRHYTDFAALMHSCRASALEQVALLDRVALHKGRFFASKWSNYSGAKVGTLRLTPPEYRVAALRGDFDSMSQMFIGELPDFDSVLAAIADAERTINAS